MSKIVDEVLSEGVIRRFEIIDNRLFTYKIINDEDSDVFRFYEYFYGEKKSKHNKEFSIWRYTDEGVMKIEDWYKKNILGKTKREELPKEIIEKYFNR